MKKCVIGLSIFALSLMIDMTPVVKALAVVDQADVVQTGLSIFGQTPLLGGGCETGLVICISY